MTLTMTETSVSKKQLDSLKRDQLHVNDEKSNLELHERDLFDEMIPCNDPKFLRPIRRLEKKIGFLTPLVWHNIIILTVFHAATFYLFLYHMIYQRNWPKWQTVLFVHTMGVIVALGVTGGAHRLWSHRSFKAKLPLKIFLLICFATAGQYDLFYWVRDHRLHHKHSETSADPHNAKRGFFFCHMGWLMMRRHPAVIREGAKIDMSDITNDPLLRFFNKYFVIIRMIFSYVIPQLIPMLLWGENWLATLTYANLFRHLCALHITWTVNSLAHLYGNKPYDKNIMPKENWFVSFMAFGEGWHNYHHTFPWDYKASEMPYFINPTTCLIDFFAKIGWAYDLKQASPTIVRAVQKNRGTN